MEMRMKRKTVGEISSELSQKEPETRSPIELEKEMQKEYMKNLLECVDTHFKVFEGDFFIEVTTKVEPLMTNVFRNYFAGRRSCPTPNYDQSVYRYNNKASQIEYLWTVPSRDACFYLRDNAVDVHPSEHELLNFVLKFDAGILLKLCKKFNKEEELSDKLVT